MSFSNEEIQYYQRQLILPGFGLDGQSKLKEARIAVVGAGGLGCPVLLYLAAAGVGSLGIIDNDIINRQNLHRQILYTVNDIGKYKADQAALRLAEHNPAITTIVHRLRLSAENCDGILAAYDLVIDGSDNFETRYLVADRAKALGKTLVSGAVFRNEGQVAVFTAQASNGYRELFPRQPSTVDMSCEVAGIMGTICMTIAGFMSNEAIKLITGSGNTLSGKLLQIDLSGMHMNTFTFDRSDQ